MEEELEVDPQRASFEQAIALLQPLRQHRQARAERLQRAAYAALEHSRGQLAEAEAELDSERRLNNKRRTELVEEHLHQSISLDDVDRWHDRERRMLDQLALLRHDIRQQHTLIEQQQEQLRQACAATSQAQRAVEKLACLTEVLNDES